MTDRKFLHGWKEIASYIGMGVRTVQRYELELMLPVRRPAEIGRGVVVAFSDEIDAWLAMTATRVHGSRVYGEVASDITPTHPVVVVEDREEDVEYARFCLAEAGFQEVVVFHSPRPAIEYLQLSRDGKQPLPKGILLDLLLHRDNGFEVLRFCHSQPCLQSVPVVIWTQLLGPTEKEIAHWLGAKRFLTKGTTQARMADQLRAVFSDSASAMSTTPS